MYSELGSPPYCERADTQVDVPGFDDEATPGFEGSAISSDMPAMRPSTARSVSFARRNNRPPGGIATR